MGLIRGRPRSDSHPLAAVTITSGATAAEKNTIDVTSTATKARETFGERPISTSACTALAVASDNAEACDSSESDGETAPVRAAVWRAPLEPAPVVGEKTPEGGRVGGLPAAEARA